MTAKKTTKTGPLVKVANAVADGKGGYLAKGAALEGVGEETLASLRAKGLID